MQNELLVATLEAMRQQHPDLWTTLPAYKVSSEDLAVRTSLSIDVVKKFLQAFAIKASPASNTQFDSLSAFNQVNAFPFIDLAACRSSHQFCLQPCIAGQI